jgi:hypothetical protein
MTMVEDKLLRGERTHTVPQQNVWLAHVLVLRDDSKSLSEKYQAASRLSIKRVIAI